MKKIAIMMFIVFVFLTMMATAALAQLVLIPEPGSLLLLSLGLLAIGLMIAIRLLRKRL
jgi:hypothetical protein